MRQIPFTDGRQPGYDFRDALSLLTDCQDLIGRKFPDIISQIIMFLKLDNIFKHLKVVDRYLMKNFNYKKENEVDQVMGAFFVTTRKVINNMNFVTIF